MTKEWLLQSPLQWNSCRYITRIVMIFIETVLKLIKQCLEKLESPKQVPTQAYPRPEQNAWHWCHRTFRNVLQYKKELIWCENGGLKEQVSKQTKPGKGTLTLVEKICLLAKSQINISCSSGLKTWSSLLRWVLQSSLASSKELTSTEELTQLKPS